MSHFRKLLSVILYFIVSAFLLSCAPTVRTIIVDETDVGSAHPNLVATDGSNEMIYLAWNENGAKFSGAKMGEPLRTSVDVLPASHSPPQLAAYGRNVYMASSFHSSGNDMDIYFSASSNHGETFSNAVEVSNNDTYSYHVGLAAYSNNAYIAWLDYPSGSKKANVLFRKSDDSGQSFSSITSLGSGASIGSQVKISAHDSNVYVVWCDTTGKLQFAKSEDSGASFSSARTLGEGALCGGEELLVLGNNVYVGWSGIGNNDKQDIFVRVSSTSGDSFLEGVNVSNTPGSSTRAHLSASYSNVYVIWEDDTPGNKDILFSRSTNGGRSFEPSVNLSNNSVASWFPHVAASGSYVHVVWQQDLGTNWEIAYRRSSDDGESFGPVLNNPDRRTSPLDDMEPVIVARGVDRYIAWTRSSPNSAREKVMLFTSTSCPVFPSESGIFRCSR